MGIWLRVKGTESNLNSTKKIKRKLIKSTGIVSKDLVLNMKKLPLAKDGTI
jgi:hypothetical protein